VPLTKVSCAAEHAGSRKKASSRRSRCFLMSALSWSVLCLGPVIRTRKTF
jgi:hypothetical protein